MILVKRVDFLFIARVGGGYLLIYKVETVIIYLVNVRYQGTNRLYKSPAEMKIIGLTEYQFIDIHKRC